MRRIAERLVGRIGFYRAAALLVLGALVCDTLSRQVLVPGSALAIVARLGSIAFFVLATIPFTLALRGRGAADGGE